MRRLRDMSIAASVLALCAWGVLAQLDASDSAGARRPPPAPLAVGEVLEIDFPLLDLEDPPKPRNVMAWYGARATVLYTWSVPCPCIGDLEPRIRRLQERFGDAEGVRWVAVAGDPGDTLEALQARHADLGSTYPVLRDPDQLLCRRLDLVRAGQVAVLDGAGRLAYRGAVDDDLLEGHAEHLEEALAAVLDGASLPVPERPAVYGCTYAVPASCLLPADERP